MSGAHYTLGTSIGSAQIGVDTSKFVSLMAKIRAYGPAFDQAVKDTHPEFGAYMRYSLFLELGTRKMKAIPHIVPAVYSTANAIVKELQDSMIETLQMLRGDKPPSAAQIKTSYRQAWLRALNGITRPVAASKAPVKYGFHKRSIHGYVDERSASDIKAEQKAAEAESGVKHGVRTAKNALGRMRKSRKAAMKKATKSATSKAKRAKKSASAKRKNVAKKSSLLKKAKATLAKKVARRSLAKAKHQGKVIKRRAARLKKSQAKKLRAKKIKQTKALRKQKQRAAKKAKKLKAKKAK